MDKSKKKNNLQDCASVSFLLLPLSWFFAALFTLRPKMKQKSASHASNYRTSGSRAMAANVNEAPYVVASVI